MQKPQSQQEMTAQPQQTQTMSRHTIEQRRGKQAWENIRAIKELGKGSEKKLEKEYRSLARGLNAMIQINGLGQTLGFFLAKGKPPAEKHQRGMGHYQLLSHLTEWMQDPEHFYAANSDVMKGRYDGLLTWVLHEKTSSDDYRRATTECLAFGVWLSRFAEAELKDPEDIGSESKEAQTGEATK